MKLTNKFFILIALLCSNYLVIAQPKEGELGSKGTYSVQGFYTNYPDSKERHYEVWYEGAKIVSGQYVENKKEGLWKYSSISSSIFFQGNYKENKKNGSWKYFSNKKPLCVIYYKNNMKDSLWQSFYENGKKHCIANYSNDHKNGSFKIFYDNGNLAYEAIYKNDSIIGNCITYYKDSIIRTNIEYRNDEPYNVVVMNDSLGHPVDFGDIKNGTGLLKTYHANGLISSKMNYVNGVCSGPFYTYYTNGRIRANGEYKNNKRFAKCTFYNEKGEEITSKFYKEEAPGTSDSVSIATEIPIFTDDIFSLGEQMPSMQGGEIGMFIFIQKNIIYPKISKETGISGTVYATFRVNPVGSIDLISILKGVNQELNSEAANVINRMPPWTPGIQNGFPVNIQFNLPIKFTLR